MSQLATTACCRCREQKLKCSREEPICGRCLKLGTNCIFPPPPDRKSLAALRATPRKRKAKADDSIQIVENLEIHNGSCADIVDHLVQPLRRLFMDVYFTCMYNSSLLFHRPTLSTDIDMGRVPGHVLLAIYATATVFVNAESPVRRQNPTLFQTLGDLKSLGENWAVTAGKEVLQGIDRPCLNSIRACEILALFWFAAGDSQRNIMFSGIAYKAACAIGLDRKKSSPSLRNATAGRSGTQWLQDEIERRCFWATWLTNCINSEHYTVGTSVNDHIMNLPLPMNDLAYASSVEAVDVAALSPAERTGGDLGSGADSTTGTMAELVKLMMIWAQIRDHLEARKRISLKERLADLFDIDSRLIAWTSTLPASLTYSKRNLYEQLVVHQQPVYIFIHALHQQCRLVLHSSLVPQFCGASLLDSVPVELISVSARVALKSAQSLSELGADLIALDWDFAQVAPFVGYCMYVSASIHIVFLFSQDEALATLARTKLISNLKVLKTMKTYWANLDRLWARIHILYEAQTSQPQPVPQTELESPADSQDAFESIEKLAHKKRDPGNLNEPLERSILEYNMPSPSSKDQERNFQDLEKRIYPDPLVRLIEEEFSRHHTQQQQPQPYATTQSPDAFPTPMKFQSSVPFATGSNASMASSQAVNVSIPSYLQDGANEWWQVNLDDLAQTTLGYGDLFNFDFNG